jgi:hypothetical protein
VLAVVGALAVVWGLYLLGRHWLWDPKYRGGRRTPAYLLNELSFGVATSELHVATFG